MKVGGVNELELRLLAQRITNGISAFPARRLAPRRFSPLPGDEDALVEDLVLVEGLDQVAVAVVRELEDVRGETSLILAADL